MVLGRSALGWVLAWAMVGASSWLGSSQPPLPVQVGFHRAVFDGRGRLEPWTSWEDALAREMAWYQACPVGKEGYPRFIHHTFLNGKYKPTRDQIIPATQLGMGILSYLKYWEYHARRDGKVLALARKMGDYLVREANTPDAGPYPCFTRSTGNAGTFPISRSSQGDQAFGRHVIEPDKGGVAGYALLKLYEATGEARYLDQAFHNAKVLCANMRPGDAAHAPWPFRVEATTGRAWGERNGNMVFILRLFDGLLAKGHLEFQAPRQALWTWIRKVELTGPFSREASPWMQFFEDHAEEDNRTSWAPLEMARYLLERKEALDPLWLDLARQLVDETLVIFGRQGVGGVVLLGEQDLDLQAWGGACSKLGGVAALLYAAGGGERYGEIARRNLNWMTYFIDADGCPAALTGDPEVQRGGWQEDCHTDVVHNFMDALSAVPAWRSGTPLANPKP